MQSNLHQDFMKYKARMYVHCIKQKQKLNLEIGLINLILTRYNPQN